MGGARAPVEGLRTARQLRLSLVRALEGRPSSRQHAGCRRHTARRRRRKLVFDVFHEDREMYLVSHPELFELVGDISRYTIYRH